MTDRAVSAAHNRSPFLDPGPLPPFDTSRLEENSHWIRELFKSLGESLTQEEWITLFKLARAVSSSFSNLDPKQVHGLNQAWMTMWELMTKYRTTGEP
jgi:hypothetical protein